MKTDDLIAALAADNAARRRTTAREIALALGAGLAIACAVFLTMLGPRHDFMAAMRTQRFVFKFVVMFVLAASATVVVFPMSRPIAQPSRWRPLLLAAPALLIAAVIAELVMLPSGDWMRFWMGHNALVCMASIPAIAAGPLALMLLALREGAPANPARTGAIAGLIAGGFGALFYAAHCTDDSPLFVATWYVIAIGFVSAVGSAVGAKFLRW